MGSGHDINSNNENKQEDLIKLTDMICTMNIEMNKVKTQKIKSKRNFFKLTLQKGKTLAKLNSTPSKATLLMRKTNKIFHEESEEIEDFKGTSNKSNLRFYTPNCKKKRQCFVEFENCKMCIIDYDSTKEDTLC